MPKMQFFNFFYSQSVQKPFNPMAACVGKLLTILIHRLLIF